MIVNLLLLFQKLRFRKIPERSKIMVNIQLYRIINEYTAYKNSTKQYAAFIEFPFADLVKFILLKPDLSSPARAKFHSFSIPCHVLPHSSSIYICIFIYTVFSRLYLIIFLPRKENTSERT